ncbi:hypothetical protein [Amorphus orientalis]|uniref:Uncharacterized protein n=1 Tax=Amorphus orientalis TaxID=649198 RepID=A0AAE3VME0_9HYPH|nr:hypothetical protein [Amorphus orientalis]MDQ0314346.1 hypothetical protein [Amorphus orientalis]
MAAAPIREPENEPGTTDPLRPVAPGKQTPDQPADEETDTDVPAAEGDTTPQSAPPPVQYGDADLPPQVARMRTALMEAARSGRIEELRPVFQQNEMPPTVSFEGADDPIDYLRSMSGDPEGREVLALLLEILEAGWVHVDQGTPQEMYVWPYFARWPLEGLDPRQEVELYRILTAYDVEEMRRHGGYIFYRVGIGPDGTLHYFVAGH